MDNLIYFINSVVIFGVIGIPLGLAVLASRPQKKIYSSIYPAGIILNLFTIFHIYWHFNKQNIDLQFTPTIPVVNLKILELGVFKKSLIFITIFTITVTVLYLFQYFKKSNFLNDKVYFFIQTVLYASFLTQSVYLTYSLIFAAYFLIFSVLYQKENSLNIKKNLVFLHIFSFGLIIYSITTEWNITNIYWNIPALISFLTLSIVFISFRNKKMDLTEKSFISLSSALLIMPALVLYSYDSVFILNVDLNQIDLFWGNLIIPLFVPLVFILNKDKICANYNLTPKYTWILYIFISFLSYILSILNNLWWVFLLLDTVLFSFLYLQKKSLNQIHKLQNIIALQLLGSLLTLLSILYFNSIYLNADFSLFSNIDINSNLDGLCLGLFIAGLAIKLNLGLFYLPQHHFYKKMMFFEISIYELVFKSSLYLIIIKILMAGKIFSLNPSISLFVGISSLIIAALLILVQSNIKQLLSCFSLYFGGMLILLNTLTNHHYVNILTFLGFYLTFFILISVLQTLEANSQKNIILEDLKGLNKRSKLLSILIAFSLFHLTCYPFSIGNHSFVISAVEFKNQFQSSQIIYFASNSIILFAIFKIIFSFFENAVPRVSFTLPNENKFQLLVLLFVISASTIFYTIWLNHIIQIDPILH